VTPSASRTEPCIAEQVLPNVSFGFADDIDLMDETLREGAERATVPPTLEAKADLAEAIAHAGIRSIVVGMFPDVPHNIAFLKELVERQSTGRIPQHVRFLVISHVGITFRQTLDALNHLSIPLSSVWIIAIHSVSDLQMRHLFPTILRKDPALAWDDEAWSRTSDAEMRRFNLKWFDEFLPSLAAYQGGGVMVGLLDAFRADHEHLVAAAQTVARHPVTQIRLVDTAGTCLPHQVQRTVGELVSGFPQIQFFGHFHDDFGMATGNAMTGLSLGLKGVDVSVGGFANRAGHPPLAEVTMALRKLYGIALPGFRYDQLTRLSRLSESLYGLMENPAQAVTGVITHSVQSGIRTELLRRAPTIFDILDPREVGADLVRMFGVRSGRDGLLRFLRETGVLEPLGLAPSAEIADRLYPALEREWKRRSAQAHEQLQGCIRDYHSALNHSFFTEDDVRVWLEAHISQLNSTEERV
jgi:isopropylmalate/homocitrate/citramalate synthase